VRCPLLAAGVVAAALVVDAPLQVLQRTEIATLCIALTDKKACCEYSVEETEKLWCDLYSGGLVPVFGVSVCVRGQNRLDAARSTQSK
jgi:hypothetical protein